MSNFTANSTVAINASNMVSALVNVKTPMAKREELMRSLAMQTKPFKGAFNGALAAHNKFKTQMRKPTFDLATLEEVEA